MKYIIALFGKSGSGKDALKDNLLTKYPKIKPIYRMTTRPMREGEDQYAPYIFITPDCLRSIALHQTEMLAEVEEKRDWNYATHKQMSFKDNSNIYIGCYSIDSVDGLHYAYLSDEDVMVIPIHIVASGKIRLLRQLTREEDPDCFEICRRFQADLIDYSYDLDFPYSTVSNEEDIDTALGEIEKILVGLGIALD